MESAPGKDRRRTRKVSFWEARLCAAQCQGRARTLYEASFDEVESIGELWAQATRQAGWGLNSHIHAVGDGAVWIRHQAERLFGSQGRYLVDFYHLSEYLHKAAEACAKNPRRWFKTQQSRLRKGRSARVIKTLARCLEEQSIPDEQAPVRAAHRYMKNRKECFHYDLAIAADLPIGSGLIESGHKHVLKARMKIPGAAWNIENADAFAHARAFRANLLWDSFWNQNAA